MKILLVQPWMDGEQSAGFICNWDVSFPIGIAYVAAAVEHAGHQARIIDLQTFTDPCSAFQAEILRATFDAVGVSVSIASQHSARWIVEHARSVRPEVPIVVGGPYPSVYGGRKTLGLSDAITCAVIGEGERAVGDLLDTLAREGDLAEVGSLAFRRDGAVIQTDPYPLLDIDAIPLPARHLFDLPAYRRLPPGQFIRLPLLPLLSTRGCPYRCKFCDDKAVWRGKVRMRSAESVVDEMEQMVRVYGAREIKFYDDSLTLSRRRAVALCEALIERNLETPWRCSARVDEVDPELLALMKRAGCHCISFGIESGDDRILQRMVKDITVQQVRDAVGWTRDAGILANGMFMLNYPGETIETTEKTLALARELDLHFVSFNLTMPLGTELREEVEASYRINREVWDSPAYNGSEIWFHQDGLPEEYLRDVQARATREFYLRPSFVIRSLKTIRNRDVAVSYLRGLKRLLGIVAGTGGDR